MAEDNTIKKLKMNTNVVVILLLGFLTIPLKADVPAVTVKLTIPQF